MFTLPSVEKLFHLGKKPLEADSARLSPLTLTFQESPFLQSSQMSSGLNDRDAHLLCDG